jgi:hypothetical protein
MMTKAEINKLSRTPCTVTNHNAALRRLIRQRDSLAVLLREVIDQGKNISFSVRAERALEKIAR